MKSERWEEVEAVFEAALQRPPEERAAFLECACQDDSSLRSQVETLLNALDPAGTSIGAPAFGIPLSDTLVEPASVIGKRLGSYRIVQEIGRGGMGTVYLAVRADDEFQKRVAIKLIKRGMDTDFIVRRFRNERQILASLDHSHIARLLDGGTTEDGLPYFVMEYVEGQPIFQYCDYHKLTIVDRLKLFREVCSAVHYAHQNLVIHRDLKPSNIQVTAEGVPKLLDFGIAKLLNPDMASQTLDPTTAAVRLMTPEFASPEQIRGETVTACSDVYSLGVLLYEFLTDHRPYKPRDHSSHELARVICEEEPDLPSIVVNLIEVIPTPGGEPLEITPETVSRARSTTPDQLRRELAGSIDNIVLKAMRKEIRDRYGSVEEFSEDVRRYLEGHPVSAPSYFPSRTSSQIDTADQVTGSRSLAVLPFQVLRIEEKGDEFLGMGMADAVITKLSNIHRIMVRPTSAVVKYFDGTHNILAAGHELDVGYVLDGRIQRAGARIRLTVQLVRMRDGVPLWAAKFDENYTDIFSLEDSISEQVAQALVPRLTGEERELLLRHETENATAYQAYLKGRFFWNKFTNEGFEKALEQFREAIRLDPDYAQPYVGIADYYNWTAIYSIGAPGEYFRHAKDAASKALELDDSLAEAHAALAFTTLLYDWDWTAAEQGFQRALGLNPNYGPAHQWYSNLLAAQGRFSEAIMEIKRAQEINPLSLMDLAIGGWTYYHARQFDKAIAEGKRALEMDRSFGNGYMVLGVVYEQMGRYDEAIENLRKSLDAMEGSMLPLWALGYTLAKAGRRPEAQEVADRLKQLSEQVYISPYYMAMVHTGLGDREAAFACLEKACEIRDEWLIWLGTEPKLDELRADPRFTDLLRRVGLKGDETARAISYSGNSGANATARNIEKIKSRTGEIGAATPTLADAVNAVYRDHRRERAYILGIAASAVLLVAAFIGYRLLPKPIVHFTATKLDKLTASGNVISAAISRDGKYAAYVMDESGRQGLWVRQIAIANSIRIVPPAAVEYRGVVFSNDSNYLYYVVYEQGGKNGNLYQVPTLGGSVRELKHDVDSPISFSPDAKKFVFIRNNPAQGEDALIIADVDSNAEQQAVARKFPDHFSLLTSPAWSPDGKVVACVTQTSDNNSFYLKITGIRPGSGSESSLSSLRWLEINQISWLPDDSGLVISAQDSASAFYHLWFVDYLRGQERRITNDLNDYLAVSVSSDPLLLLSVQRQTLTNIWTTPRNDWGHPVQITSGAGRFFDLRWTPDGKILYASDASGNADIWEMAAGGTNQKQLTAGVGRNYAPAASPDGHYIVFHSNRSGRWQIWRMGRDGSNPMQLTDGKEDSNWPEFSPDGLWVFYQHVDSGTPTVWKIPIDGGTPVRLISTLSMRPAISAEGKKIAYWEKDQTPNAPWRIAVASLDEQQPVKFLEVPESSANGQSGIQLTPDGSAVLFIDYRNGVTKLMSQPLDGSPVKQLTSFAKEQFYSFAMSPDGRLVFSRGIRTSDAVLIGESR